jgi:uncharacterized membrane protein
VLTPDGLQRLAQRIAGGERRHSGEIRICVEAGLPNSYLLRADSTAALLRQRALAQFGKLRVWDTEHNNGVLIYLLLAERAIEVVADRGLNSLVSREEWSALVQRLGLALRHGDFEAGLMEAVDQVSAVLESHFALAPGIENPNELSDQPTLR